MHSVLQIYELLSHIFQNLKHTNHRHLLSCSLVCKAFSEAALDVMWEYLPSVTLLPFASSSEYKGYLDTNGQHAEVYLNHLERLKFYGKRVREMRIQVHSKLMPELLEYVLHLRDVKSYDINPDDTTPAPIISTIFPGLTTLILALSARTNVNNDTNEAIIRTFLLPTVKSLTLYCYRRANHKDLKSINSVGPSLTSLTLSEEVFLGSHLLNAELESEICTFFQSLPRLESLSFPLSGLTAPVFVSIAGLLELRNLSFSYPVQTQRSIPSSTSDPFESFHLMTLQHGAFFKLRSLKINARLNNLHQILYAHPSLTSHITHLSLICVTLTGLATRQLFPSSLPSSSLPSLTHLSLIFVSAFPIPETRGPVASSLRPIYMAPFAPRLTSLLVEHGAPLNLNDDEYNEMARKLPNIEVLRFQVSRHRLPRTVLQSQQRSIRASLAALVSFVKHCPNLREISMAVDAETRPVPVGEVTGMPLGAHAVKVDMSVSPVGEDTAVVAAFFARHFPHRRSELTSCSLDFAEDKKLRSMILQDEDGLEDFQREDDPFASYALRWKTIAELARSKNA